MSLRLRAGRKTETRKTCSVIVDGARRTDVGSETEKGRQRERESVCEGGSERVTAREGGGSG